MKLLLTIALLCVALGNATPLKGDFVSFNEKEKNKEEIEGNATQKKNVHSIKKWKMTIEYANGNVISKTIVVSKNSKFSALETAFEEAEKYLKNIKNVKEYSISPVTSSYVLLAGN
ncbi:hypothetical protein [Aquimarina longa]|uniref:hypothetical protein n=1 Tax=Aquimarina longa TaxID=1080221 RepID=UPI0007861960|nr:hypothetical protein [Aquimarina longa]